jgi:transaldolase
MAGQTKRLPDFGQSVWFDDINRDAIRTGKLAELVEGYGVSGGTSNPTIFEKAFSASDAYDQQLSELTQRLHEPDKIQEELAVTDVQLAADLFRPIYDRTGGLDGYASLEVSPDIAHDTQASIVAARRAFALLDRPNVMIKIPGTPAGLPAIEACLAEGININITLLFSVVNYEQVAEAYQSALERRLEMGRPLDTIASVASFFVSRVDTLVDEKLKEYVGRATTPADKEVAQSLLGATGIANAKLAYQKFIDIVSSPRWQTLASAGARVQRCLWASTSTKEPSYSDVMYIDNLVGPDTINTMPEPTIYAFDDHGSLSNSLTEDTDLAQESIERLQHLGLDLEALTRQLQDDGVEKFATSYKDALEAIAARVPAHA